MKKFIESIRNLLSKKLPVKDVNDGRVKWWFANYLEINNLHEGIWQLHAIDVVTSEKEVTITLVVGRPGMVIGKGGETIDNITKMLSEVLEKTVRIKLVEYNVWH